MDQLALLFVLLLGAVVTVPLGDRLKLPAPVLMTIGGVVLALVPVVPNVDIPPEYILPLVLPPLLYASAEEIPWRELRVVWRPVTVLAFGLVLATAAAVGVVASAVTPLNTTMAFVLGAVLASTD
ncbi:cation:proton antiporter domain-containing protein, partial [Streptomyces sp. NPDC054838]